MSLRVLAPGLYTLVVDLGRPHCRSLGVPVGGAADRTALALGNALVGNPPDAAALEFTLLGPTLQATCELACVVYGAPFELKSDRQHLTAGTTFTLTAGEELEVRGTPEGARGYLCVRGGLQTPVILGSRSGLGPVQAGEELPCSPATIRSRFFRRDFDWERVKQRRDDFPGPYHFCRALPGPQGDWFPLPGHFFADRRAWEPPPPRFRVTPASNRMGVRLEGTPLPVPDRELVSEPVCPGAVQVTRDGQCIVLGMDGQTIGGYPKVAQVISADLDLVGQLRPGDEVLFVEVGLEEAERLYREKQAELAAWVTRLRIAAEG
ncbi:MAG: biotin-dependent carboxyltransferase family protein [Gemmataceae bacterium]|nr:biotin-dependent carboxyltransferase family protein [Gemmataceae bacterium]